MKTAIQITVVVALAVAVTAVVVAQISSFNLIDAIADLFGLDDDETEIVDSKVIVLGIKDLAVLETVRSDILIEQTAQKSNRFSPDTHLKVRYIGRIVMGIDMSKLTAQNVALTGGEITITLPPVQITGCYLQEPEVLKWSCGYIVWSGGTCDDRLKDLQNIIYKGGLAELLIKADQLNLADAAYQNAEQQIYELVTQVGSYPKVNFTRSTDTLPPDDSCFVAESASSE